MKSKTCFWKYLPSHMTHPKKTSLIMCCLFWISSGHLANFEIIVFAFCEFQTYQIWLDKWTPHTASRWIFTVVLIVVFMLRIVLKQVRFLIIFIENHHENHEIPFPISNSCCCCFFRVGTLSHTPWRFIIWIYSSLSLRQKLIQLWHN